MSTGKIAIAAALILVAGGITAATILRSDRTGELDQFAQCLGEKGALFYGAFWCPACQSQKALFGKSAKLIPYFECSTPDRKQNAACNEKKVERYPTWDFADGSREVGVLSLAELAAKTGCALPAGRE